MDNGQARGAISNFLRILADECDARMQTIPSATPHEDLSYVLIRLMVAAPLTHQATIGTVFLALQGYAGIAFEEIAKHEKQELPKPVEGKTPDADS